MNEQKEHIIKALQQGIRLDGRKLDEFREMTIENDVSKTAEGSVKITLGEAEVIAGVKLGVGAPWPDVPDQGSLMVNAELLPLSSPDFEMGPPRIESIETSRVIDRGIRESGCMDTKKLCIEAGESVWLVQVDVCPINHDGNLIDMGGIAAIAALKQTVYPSLEGNKPDYKNMTDKKLEIEKCPIPVTVIKIGDVLLVDPTDEEQALLDARLTVTSLEDGTICSLQKGGDEPLSHEEVDKMVEMAVKCAKDIRAIIGE